MVPQVFGLLALCALPLTHVSAIPLDLQAVLGYKEVSPNTPTGFELPEDIETLTRPSWFESTLMARRLLAKSSSGVISTVFPNPLPPSARSPASIAGLPIGLREYIADCDGALPSELTHSDNGDPTILALRVATTFKNIGTASNFSLELDWWDHIDQAGPVYPGLPLSPAALPRVTLFGYLDPLPGLSNYNTAELEQCFLKSHPDAKVWLPGASGSPHSSFWARMVVTQAYWIGGFGDVQHIGWIDINEWKGIRRYKSENGVGDGRGWEDVRLPGEDKE
ncbi:FMN-binding split barrel-like protein [Penicillium malachiteum]|uniref:FMN-binding split barrel-like protein n=1 Tax=Penicillium malachiteum TaxID=1324776 RepID=UPI0025485E06|nr:FMN-binding split barrel-like protein [Penicillium malachiteum]KAJ5734936.1 FMN-binding split barrel-like protein [Penicillium malachiteum]